MPIYALYDDLARMLRMIRLRTRFSFAIDDRTMMRYQNVREAKLETLISGASMVPELRRMALEPQAGEILKALEVVIEEPPPPPPPGPSRRSAS